MHESTTTGRPARRRGLNWRNPKVWRDVISTAFMLLVVTFPRLVFGIALDLIEYEYGRPKFLVRLIRKYGL